MSELEDKFKEVLDKDLEDRKRKQLKDGENGN